MSDKCLKCNGEIKLGKLVEQNGKKFYEKFDLDGKPHVCPTKQSGKPYIPQKPREEFVFVESRRGKLPNEQDYVRTYEIHRFGFVGELDTQKTYAEMQMTVFKFLASEEGNPVTRKEPEKK